MTRESCKHVVQPTSSLSLPHKLTRSNKRKSYSANLQTNKLLISNHEEVAQLNKPKGRRPEGKLCLGRFRDEEGSVRSRDGTNGLSLLMVLFVAVVAMSWATQLATAHEDVAELEGASDFNKVRLRWRYPRMGAGFLGFKITHCEDQAWGSHRCRNIVLHPNELSQTPLRNGMVEYSGQVSHLRMATNYTMEVTPIMEHQGGGGEPGGHQHPLGDDQARRTSSAKGRAIPDRHHSAQVFIQTKGFSARALSCLTNSTQVEVDTGPNFGGKISVEGSLDPACATHGNAKDKITKYRLDINHSLCGSKLINDSVRTYILVQENLPILTHSTRRFMVVCHYVPEAFTVSAGVSLPEESGPPLVPVDHSVNEVDPSELFDSTNDLFGSLAAARPPSRRSGKALKLAQEEKTASPRMWTQLVLMVILVVGAVVGLSCAFWHFGRHSGMAARFTGDTVSTAGDELESVHSARSSEVSFASEENDTEQQMQDQLQQLQQNEVLEAAPSSSLPCESFQDHLLNACTTKQMPLVDELGNSKEFEVDSEVPVSDLLTEDSVMMPGGNSSNTEEIPSNIGVKQEMRREEVHVDADEVKIVAVEESIYVNTSVGNKWESFDDESLKGCDVLGPVAV